MTAELDEPLRVLKREFDLLARALSTAIYRRIWRDVLTKIQDMLWSDVLVRQSFTTLGATQFARDLQALYAIIDRHIPDGSAAMSTIQDGVKLLSLPMEPTGNSLSLQQASDRIFTDNTQAKRVLEELDIETLSPPNARKILQRRVENSD